MDKRYQVFVSSTYTDLRAERQTAMLRLLALNCIPTGMELFPASDESAWELIERVIKASDYYILIVGGRYGSASSENPLSFTEREYDLAVELRIPILTFLHEYPGQIIAANTEQTNDGRAAYERFRKKVQAGKVVNYWTTAENLGVQVVLAMLHAKDARPRTGWIRADQAADPQTLKDLERVRREVDELRARLAEIDASAPIGGEVYLFDDSGLSVPYACRAYRTSIEPSLYRAANDTKVRTDASVFISWKSAFRLLGPKALVPTSERTLYSALHEHCTRDIYCQRAFAGRSPQDFEMLTPVLDQIKIQFLALGLWKVSSPDHELDKPVWCLTAYGRSVLTQLMAVARTEV